MESSTRRVDVAADSNRVRIYITGLLRAISLYFIIWGVVALIAALGLLAYVSIPIWFSSVCFIYGPMCMALGYFSWKRAARKSFT